MQAQLVNVKEKIKSALAITFISIVRHAFFFILLINGYFLDETVQQRFCGDCQPVEVYLQNGLEVFFTWDSNSIWISARFTESSKKLHNHW